MCSRLLKHLKPGLFHAFELQISLQHSSCVTSPFREVPHCTTYALQMYLNKCIPPWAVSQSFQHSLEMRSWRTHPAPTLRPPHDHRVFSLCCRVLPLSEKSKELTSFLVDKQYFRQYQPDVCGCQCGPLTFMPNTKPYLSSLVACVSSE